MSPDVEPSIERGGTTRKCANCGQVGHIKTNKKYVSSLFFPPLSSADRHVLQSFFFFFKGGGGLEH